MNKLIKYRIVRDKHGYKSYAFFVEEYIEPYFFGLFGGYWKKIDEEVVGLDGSVGLSNLVFGSIKKADEYISWLNIEKEIIK